MSCTEMRVPAMTGFPARIPGSEVISGDVAWLVIASTLLLGERLDSLVSWLCRLVAFPYAISSHPWRSPRVEGAESRPPDRFGPPPPPPAPARPPAAPPLAARAT